MRGIIVTLGMLIGFLCIINCGEGEESEGEKVCDKLEAKLAECNLTYEPGLQCKADDSLEICLLNCLIGASCKAVKDQKSDIELVRCNARCSGAGPDDFICADGKAFVLSAAVCDGMYQCLDGSDEADCDAADAGARD